MTSNMEPGQKPRFGNERWGGLILLYTLLTVVLFVGMLLAGWYAWTSGIIPRPNSLP